MQAVLYALCLTAALFVPLAARAADPLPAMQLEADGTTVSGLSSGAYMAVQLHVANSNSIAGAGVIAGGPYFCAQGQLPVALGRCMKTLMGEPDVEALLTRAETLAQAGRIDPLEGLAGDRVYLFNGSADETVTRPVVDAAGAFYSLAGIPEADIKYVTDRPAGHAFLTEGAENACGVSETPFINDCGYDQAGDLLQHLYGTLRAPAVRDEGRLFRFDQAEFLPEPQTHGMAPEGFFYWPAACEAGEACRLHIAFAGCRQTPDDIGDLFARTAGYNRWAESNRLVVLYPQSSVSDGNPRGCWDWWGYDDPAYHTKQGRQMAAVAKMAARLGVPFAEAAEAGFCRAYDAWNWQHWTAGRAELCGWGGFCATGSGEFIGYFYGAASLYESPENSFSTVACAP